MSRADARAFTRVAEGLAYLLLNAPDLPEEDGASLKTVFRELADDLAQVVARSPERRRQYLLLCLEELHAAEDAFNANDEDTAFRLLNAADAHLRDATRFRQEPARFIVGKNGDVQDSGRGKSIH